MASKTTNLERPHQCEYCGKGFMKEKTLFTHVCEQKRRALQKDEKRVQTGFYAFQRFYKLSAGAKTDKTYEEFCKSPYYNAFVKFGSFITNVKPLYPDKYIDHVVTSGVKLDKWCKNEMYEKYAIDLIRKESVETALERSIKTMMNWAEENNSAWNHYFNYVSTNRAVWHIKDGKISPWLILNCESGKQFLNKLNDEQLEMIFHILDPKHWASRFRQLPRDVELVKQIAQEGKL